MAWLKYTDDEVAVFHPEFETIANEVISSLGLDKKYHWQHHLKTPGVSVIPDFVLVETSSNRWILVVEIKRPRSAVFSERAQIQAKGYAEANQTLYPPANARYFCVTNFEATILFALNGVHPVRECRVTGMSFDSGTFVGTEESVHKKVFYDNLKTLVEFVIKTPNPTYEVVWPRIARTLLAHSQSLTHSPLMRAASNTVPDDVATYFAGTSLEVEKREILLRCLTAEYLKGILSRHGHPRSKTLPLLRKDISQAASIIDALKSIDFAGVFEPNASSIYRGLAKEAVIRKEIEDYLQALIAERVDILARRNDALEMPEVLIEEIYPHDVQDARGKARTDADLAALLSTICVRDSKSRIFDPGCGDGSLLSASYDTLRSFGLSHAEALGQIEGVDADPLVARIAALRLVLKEPHVISSTDKNFVRPGDMFSTASSFQNIDVVLMNPPFKRFEQRDEAAIPSALREHFRASLREAFGSVETDSGQANIYNMYVEFAVKASKSDTVLGIVLDNRWYHNKASESLRKLLLRECDVLAILSYPHDMFFAGWTIATSILVVRKKSPNSDNLVHFVRTNDPRRSDFIEVAEAIRNGGDYPLGWFANKVPQSALDSDSWQLYFSTPMVNDFRAGLPSLNAMFEFTRSGRPDREGGGTEVYALPFERTSYGHRRSKKPSPRSKFSTLKGSALTRAENDALRQAAALIPAHLRGYAIINSDDLSSYELTVTDVTKTQVPEAPEQRTAPMQARYFSKNRVPWCAQLDTAIAQIKSDPSGAAYFDLVEKKVGLDEAVLDRDELWHVLREPVAGELIIPRKLRAGHRVHINPFVYNVKGRQIRISSNFIHYYGCRALDPSTGLTREIATKLIFGFLMSSFGQLQFEMGAYNREGARSVEGHQLEKIVVFDPRHTRTTHRQAIIDAISKLPYPVPTDCDPRSVPALVALDELFADEIIHRSGGMTKDDLLGEVWNLLFEWTQARRE